MSPGVPPPLRRLRSGRPVLINTLVIFGATGDLTGRLLLPALVALRAADGLSPDFRFVGAGQQRWTDDLFAGHLRRWLSGESAAPVSAVGEQLIDRVRYLRADVTDPADVASVLDLARSESGPGPVAVYLALPTDLLLGTVRALQVCGLPIGSRVAVEKPFGYDARNAVDLNRALAGISGLAGQGAIYRVDHARAMEAVQNLPQACFPGTGRRIQWNSDHIEQIELLWEETLALEGRASFYDRAGALRDVVQNHLVQVLCTIARAEQHPADADRGDVDCRAGGSAEARVAVLQSVRSLTPQDVRTRTRRARYTAGRPADHGGVDGRMVSDYREEDGVDPGRNTETFAEVVLEIDAPQWLGTRFVLRAGKALDRRRRGVSIRFRANVRADTPAPGPVWLDLDQGGDAQANRAEAEAYLQVVADFLGGGSSFAVGAEEAELAWQIFTPVLQGWAEGSVPLMSYPAGSGGPI